MKSITLRYPLAAPPSRIIDDLTRARHGYGLRGFAPILAMDTEDPTLAAVLGAMQSRGMATVVLSQSDQDSRNVVLQYADETTIERIVADLTQALVGFGPGAFRPQLATNLEDPFLAGVAARMTSRGSVVVQESGGGGGDLPVGGMAQDPGIPGENNCQPPENNQLQKFFSYTNDTGSTQTLTVSATSDSSSEMLALFALLDGDHQVIGLLEGPFEVADGATQNLLLVGQFDPVPPEDYNLSIVLSIDGTPTYALPIPMGICLQREFTSDFTLISKDGSVPDAVEPNETLVFGLTVQTADGLPYELGATVQMLCSGSTDYVTLLETSPPGGQSVGPYAVFWNDQHFEAAEVKEYSATFQMIADLTGLTEVSFAGRCAPEGGFAAVGGQLFYPPAPPP